MSYYINTFFSAEITCIPRIVEKYIGNYYSNAVGNALTWVFAMWLILHYIFDAYLNTLLKQMHYKQHIRLRLLDALWFGGFYGTGFLYCLGTLVRNNSNVFDYRRTLIMDGGNMPLHILMGMALIGTFFFQSFIWALIKGGFDKSSLVFLMLTLLPLTTYYSRRTELFISLMALISLVQFIGVVLKCVSCTVGKGKVYLNGFFFGFLGLSAIIHVIVIPIFFIVPLVYNLRNGLHLAIVFQSLNLIAWWIFEACSNPLYKYIEHWFQHSNVKNPRICPNSVIECCLFPMRDDFTFNMCLEQWEIKQRKEKAISRRKPKDRGVFVQTLKCMVAIRRKLKNKRAESEPDKTDSSDDSESDDEGENERMKRELVEETARALQEDRQGPLIDEEITIKEYDDGLGVEVDVEQEQEKRGAVLVEND